MTTYKQDSDFQKEMSHENLLEKAIEWIQKNLEPEDVFPDSKLVEWARTKSVDEIFEPHTLSKYIKDNS